MAAPLSEDLRRRIAHAYLDGEGTRDEVARRFRVSAASVDRFVRLQRDHGSVAPKPHGGGHARRVPDGDKALLERLLGEDPSLTQQELAERYTEATGRPVSQRTMSRMLRRFEVTRKKKPSTPPSATAKTWP